MLSARLTCVSARGMRSNWGAGASVSSEEAADGFEPAATLLAALGDPLAPSRSTCEAN